MSQENQARGTNASTPTERPNLEGMFSSHLDLSHLPPPRRKRSGLAWLSLLAIIILAGAGVVYWTYGRDFSPGTDAILGQVVRGDLVVIVSEPGELESAQSVACRCEVEGRQIKIIEIVDEGTLVQKGQEVVKFDTEELLKAYQDQEIKLKQAEGKARAAEEELKVQQNKAESDIAKAKLDLTIAELERDKYLSERGEYQVQVEDAKGAIAFATKELEEANEQLSYYRTFVKKGFGTPETLRQREAGVARAKFNLVRDEAKLYVLERFTFRRQKAELEAKASDAVRELERAESTSRANIEKSRSELEASQITARLERRALERIQKQLENCIIKAPQDGILVYENTRYWDPTSAIRPGGMVYYQQPIFKLPDLSQMKVRMKVHESQIKKVEKGQVAEISVASLPNRPLRGTVQSVATLADSRGYWDERNVKEYITEVSIDDLPPEAGLKPGMSAEVRVHVGRYPDVLLVPVSAVSEREGKHFAYVAVGSKFERREIEVGETNEKFIIVKKGLDEGERLALIARKRLAAEIKAEGLSTSPSIPSSPTLPSNLVQGAPHQLP